MKFWHTPKETSGLLKVFTVVHRNRAWRTTEETSEVKCEGNHQLHSPILVFVLNIFELKLHTIEEKFNDPNLVLIILRTSNLLY